LFSDWNSADWASITIGLVLFVVGWWLSRRQGQIIEHVGHLAESQTQVLGQVGTLTGEIHDLQSAVAELQIREKVGVIREGAYQVQQGDQSAVFTLLQDTLSVLPLYEYAGTELRTIYEDALCTALETVWRHEDPGGKSLQEDMAATVVSRIRQLEGKGRRERELAGALRLIMARSAGRIYRSGDIQSAQKLCSLVFPASVVAALIQASEVELQEKLKASSFQLPSEQRTLDYYTDAPPDLFASFFRSAIRVSFNWNRFLTERWPVKIIVLGDRAHLADFYPPWYLSPSGREVGYRDEGARPFPFSAISESMNGLQQERQESIRRFSTMLARSREPVHLLVPAYALQDTRYLLLDGSHRVAALLLSDVTFRMMVFVVYGPLDAGAARDLVHWAAPS